MREINKIIVHTAYTTPDMDIGVEEIRDWHVNGNGWSDIGYHYVIRRDGTVEDGRPVEKAGAHTLGQNADSIGICLVGGKEASTGYSVFNYTLAQMGALLDLLEELVVEYSLVKQSIFGHNEFSPKACPCFDVKAYLST